MSDAEAVLHEVPDGIAIVKINRPEIRNAQAGLEGSKR